MRPSSLKSPFILADPTSCAEAFTGPKIRRHTETAEAVSGKKAVVAKPVQLTLIRDVAYRGGLAIRRGGSFRGGYGEPARAGGVG